VARGLTQKALADMVGTTQSVIARLEDADYEGHSLRMLGRIAHALDACVAVRLIPRMPAAERPRGDIGRTARRLLRQVGTGIGLPSSSNAGNSTSRRRPGGARGS
jgi:transcriptional regulator with XRE-family HTH domain